jgi:ElaA protein
MAGIILVWCDFAKLGPDELHDILHLRCAVFIVEQNCVFADIDGKDPLARHLRAYLGKEFAGCLRLFAPGILRPPAFIGRVVVAPQHRGTGLGRHLMYSALQEAARLYGPVAIELQAQSRLEDFYASFGFARISADYLEDGILHCDMRREGGVCS